MPRRTIEHDGPHPVDVIVGANLRSIRTKAGMSQTDVAAGLGLTFQQLQKYERGVNRVSASKIVELSHILGIPITALFEGVTGAKPRLTPDRMVLEIGKLASSMTRQRRAHLLTIAREVARIK